MVLAVVIVVIGIVTIEIFRRRSSYFMYNLGPRENQENATTSGVNGKEIKVQEKNKGKKLGKLNSENLKFGKRHVGNCILGKYF